MSTNDRAPGHAHLPRRLRRNRAARIVVYLGGLGTVACLLGILAFLLVEALPLFGGVTVQKEIEIDRKGPLLAMATDRFQTRMLGLDAEGGLWDYQLSDGSAHRLAPLPGLRAGERIRKAKAVGESFLIQTDRNRLLVLPLGFELSYQGSQRQVHVQIGDAQWWDADGEAGRKDVPITAFDATEMGESGFTIAYQCGGLPVHLSRVNIEENPFSGEREIEKSDYEIEVGLSLSFLRLEADGSHLVAVDGEGRIHWWSLEEDRARKRQVLETGFGKVSCVAFLQADRSLILGDESGSLRQFFRVRGATSEWGFRMIRDFPSMDTGITQIVRSTRNKAFLVGSRGGDLGLYYGTTGKRDWVGNPELGEIRSLALAPKGDGILVSGIQGSSLLSLANPHPEISMGTVFGKVWYENACEPGYTWQSTGGSDEFEAKLSMIPLIFGTLKGTFFSMVLAVPLALLAALYTSMFLHPRLKRFVKPAIEIMAAIPSVILGFLCAVYLAPMLETGFGGFMLLPISFPLFMILGSFVLGLIPPRIHSRLPAGSELLVLAAFLLASLWFSFAVGEIGEAWLFDGDAPKWITTAIGIPYEQRNAIVIAMGMSFAVIPIIFSISEDAISNVPRSLVSGSLALGANRFETAIRVVLPTASPGVFSAIMMGLGRAVGETMIVLMATGNTPIMDWNPFNGFRTLSANIAVEIPEAPHEGTLYRTLFLAAILLFFMTFVLNTLAEVVRQNLRRRYANI